jgi:pyridoxine 5-phosphate synthase
MTALSVNINKVATLRNARGGTMPNLLEVTKDLQRYGAQGITVHPRPDQRHIRYEDVRSLPEILTTEFNIEGNPIPKFIDLVMKVKPAQVTLVPDAVDALTSNAGWDTIKNQDFLKEIIKKFQSEGIRTSIFIDPVLDQIEGAAATGTDRIELYTEAYAADYTRNREIAIAPYVAASERANELGLGINAGHDLNLDNLAYFAKRIPSLLEVSIGHALICESLYLGFENVIPMYLQRLSY